MSRVIHCEVDVVTVLLPDWKRPKISSRAAPSPVLDRAAGVMDQFGEARTVLLAYPAAEASYVLLGTADVCSTSMLGCVDPCDPL
jgi:hypothetical protein